MRSFYLKVCCSNLTNDNNWIFIIFYEKLPYFLFLSQLEHLKYIIFRNSLSNIFFVWKPSIFFFCENSLKYIYFRRNSFLLIILETLTNIIFFKKLSNIIYIYLVNQSYPPRATTETNPLEVTEIYLRVWPLSRNVSSYALVRDRT